MHGDGPHGDQGEQLDQTGESPHLGDEVLVQLILRLIRALRGLSTALSEAVVLRQELGEVKPMVCRAHGYHCGRGQQVGRVWGLSRGRSGGPIDWKGTGVVRGEASVR